VRRQREDWQREATRELGTERTGAALGRYERAGMVQGHATGEEARTALVAGWDAVRRENPRQSLVILTGAHHHGPLDSVIFIISGNAPMRWGDRLEFIAKAGPGDFLLVPAWLPHQEMNASATDELYCALVRSGTEEVVVNLDIDAAAEPEWIEGQ